MSDAESELSADFSEMLDFRLRRPNCGVVTAVSGYEAWTEANQKLPDASVLDLTLPNLDSSATFRIGAYQSDTFAMPVAFLVTAVTSGVIEIAASKVGAGGFLPKPLDFDALRLKLEVSLV